MQPRLTRSRTDRMVAGVCGGLAAYFAIDPVIVRLIFVLVTLTSGIGVLLYPVLWLVMPKAGPGPDQFFPNDPEEWRMRVQTVGQEAAEFGQSVEREMREAFVGRPGAGGSPPGVSGFHGRPDAPPPVESFNFDPYTGQPIQPHVATPPRRKKSQIAGIALVGIGLIFAAEFFGISIDILLPALMVAAGVFMLLRR